MALLGLTNQQFLELERTGQLAPITICGKQKFIAKDLEMLIETYRQVSLRKGELDSDRSEMHGNNALWRKKDKKQ